MKTSNMEERLALIGALVVLFGVSMAAEDALADDAADVTTTAIAIHEAAKDTLETARTATAEAAEHAARSLALENWVDLDIRLEDHTLMMIAGRE
jgi:hypothetical protein